MRFEHQQVSTSPRPRRADEAPGARWVNPAKSKAKASLVACLRALSRTCTRAGPCSDTSQPSLPERVRELSTPPGRVKGFLGAQSKASKCVSSQKKLCEQCCDATLLAWRTCSTEQRNKLTMSMRSSETEEAEGSALTQISRNISAKQARLGLLKLRGRQDAA